MLNGRMVSEYRIGDAVERSGRGIIGDNFFGIRLQGLRKRMKDFVPGSRSPGRYLNPGFPDAKLESCTLDLEFRHTQKQKQETDTTFWW
jgi:hypothetical protein